MERDGAGMKRLREKVKSWKAKIHKDFEAPYQSNDPVFSQPVDHFCKLLFKANNLLVESAGVNLRVRSIKDLIGSQWIND